MIYIDLTRNGERNISHRRQLVFIFSEKCYIKILSKSIYSKHLFGLWQTWLGCTWMKWDSLHVKLQLEFDGILYLLRYLSLFTSMEFWIRLYECLEYYCWLSLSQTLISQPKQPGRVAQSVGHLTRKSGVLGLIPGLATYFRFSFRFFKKGSCQLLAKVCAWSTG